ncbi:helix-turn-helix domain-containing protein [Paenibacillaceae bacterium]|nr:helix-turn-helix domain-containing protein [Paenibacillaceae bacterium]
MDYIESQIEQKLTLDMVANAVQLSKFHFHRLLKAATGQPVMHYIRSRKLARSLAELSDTSLSIIEISLQYGFDFEQSYIRAFKKEFGITPAHFRKHGRQELKIVEKMNSSMASNLSGSVIFKPIYVQKPTSYLVGLKKIISYADNEQNCTSNQHGNLFYNNYSSLIENKVHHPDKYIGFTRELDDVQSYYLPSMEVHSLATIPDGLDFEIVPANQYAVFKYICNFHPMNLTIHHLDEIWTFIDEYWQLHSDYAKADCYYFESIDSSYASEDYGEVDIYIPAKAIGKTAGTAAIDEH